MRIAFDLDNTLIPNAFDFETELPNRKWMAKLFRKKFGIFRFYAHICMVKR
jgi:FMN phosphatase YigB (HAD superfamily)